ncbi:MAG TPA: glycosyltransferase family 39 protein [Anaerolineae bacterium]|nr:glycosyltransferase family 39 protein [Anaerolineae bacterium]
MTTLKRLILGSQSAATPRLKPLSIEYKPVFAGFSLGLIVLLGAFLRFYDLGAYSVGNAYYAATVQSMLTSWPNFFFAAFEPGGSVTVDKPPLGFWVQAVSAYFLGVNGFALALPQALAGVLSIPLLYLLVKRQFGRWAGLIAALALATMPITIATERNNTIDGLLLFVLLLAAYAFIQAAQHSRLRDLLLGAVLVGLGFNIKMLQAFMPLPAFYALYWFGAPQPWRKRLLHLALATAVLAVVSLSWAVAVDLTPASSRPFIGSSSSNSVLELIVGHNGLRRLGFDTPGGGQPPAPNGSPPDQRASQLAQRPPQPPATGSENRPGPPPSRGPGPGPGGEVGSPSPLRLFTEPLASQASWLLPLALLGLPFLAFQLGRARPLSQRHLALGLWAGWLLPELLYFSLTPGLFHTYYLIMLGPPLAALVGVTAWGFRQALRQERPGGQWWLTLLTGLTLVFQVLVLNHYSDFSLWLIAGSVTLWGVGLLALRLVSLQVSSRVGQVALSLVLASLMLAPLAWSGLTTFNPQPDAGLPCAEPVTEQPDRPNGFADRWAGQPALLDYLLAHTEPETYLVATVSAQEASPLILATHRPVLTFGGFTGSDDVIDAERLAQMVSDGKLRYVLGPLDRKPEINTWVTAHCLSVQVPGLDQPEAATVNPDPPGPGRARATNLFDCLAQ